MVTIVNFVLLSNKKHRGGILVTIIGSTIAELLDKQTKPIGGHTYIVNIIKCNKSPFLPWARSNTQLQPQKGEGWQNHTQPKAPGTRS